MTYSRFIYLIVVVRIKNVKLLQLKLLSNCLCPIYHNQAPSTPGPVLSSSLPTTESHESSQPTCWAPCRIRYWWCQWLHLPLSSMQIFLASYSLHWFILCLLHTSLCSFQILCIIIPGNSTLSLSISLTWPEVSFSCNPILRNQIPRRFL